MRSRFLIPVLFLFCFGLTLHAQQIEWLGGQRMGGTQKDRGDALAIDRKGNVFIGGAYTGTATFSGQQVISRGAFDGYVAMFNSNSALRWITSFGGTDTLASVQVRGVSIDSSGNIYAAGSFTGTVSFAAVTLTSERVSIFLTKLDSTGRVLWARQAGDRPSLDGFPGGGVGAGVAVDRNGNAYVTGTVDDSVYFDNNLVVGDFSDVFIARYSPSGVVQWVRQAGGPLPDNGQKVCVDPNGNPIITGTFVDSAYFGATKVVSYGWEDIFVAKYDGTGNAQWARSGGGLDLDLALGVTVDGQGNVYATGIYTLPMAFGSVILPVNGEVDMYLVKYNASGVFQWGNRSSGFGAEIAGSVIADADGNTYTVGSFSGRGVFGRNGEANTVSQGTADIFVLKNNASGEFQWMRRAAGSPIDSSPAGNAVAVGPAGDVYVSGLFYGRLSPGSLLLQSTGSADIFLARLGDPGSFPSISGMIYGDVNGDGLYDATEPGLRERMIEVTPGPIYATTDSSGLYKLYLDAGTYTLRQVLKNYWRHTAPASPGTHTVTITGVDSVGGKNFGTQAIPGIQDLKVCVTNIWPARPGFEQYYVISYTNQGTTEMDGSVSFLYDPQLTYDIADPLPDVHIGNRLQWNFQDLLPGDTRHILVNMALSPAIGLDVPLISYATIEPLSSDSTPPDNNDTLVQVTQGSFDPNDITVLPSDGEGVSTVVPGQPLTYIIRFQNTGTDTAFTVVVIDTLDKDLDPATFQMASASHDYTYEISGEGIVTWRFNNILLPDVVRDEPRSHGFIRYTVLPRKGLKNGTLFNNRAAIYFDFNKPVITNTVTSVLTGVAGVQMPDIGIGAGHSLYPTPLRTSATLKLAGDYRGPYNVTLHDELGKVVRVMRNVQENAIRIDRDKLPSGIYFYNVTTIAGTVARGKVVVE